MTIGYGENKKTVGQVIYVASKSLGLKGMIDQHMWGGYQFNEKGNILTDTKSGAILAN